jgi:hypothetical protein
VVPAGDGVLAVGGGEGDGNRFAGEGFVGAAASAFYSSTSRPGSLDLNRWAIAAPSAAG